MLYLVSRIVPGQARISTALIDCRRIKEVDWSCFTTQNVDDPDGKLPCLGT